MSDDEASFSILHLSPMPSLKGSAIRNRLSALESDTPPGNRFASLKINQLSDLKNAQEIANQTTHEEHPKEHEIDLPKPMDGEPFTIIEKQSKSQTVQPSKIRWQIADPVIKKPSEIQCEIADPVIEKPSERQCEMTDPVIKSNHSSEYHSRHVKLWEKHPVVNENENKVPFSLETKSFLEKLQKIEERQQKTEEEQRKTEEKQNQQMTNSGTQTIFSEEKSTMTTSSKSDEVKLPPSLENKLAASFILGEIDADILKTSVYSQFPSIAMEATAEDVLKLQSMVLEHSHLKSTMKNANATMKQFYKSALQCKEKMKVMEEQYERDLESCHNQIEMLGKQNHTLESNFNAQVAAIEVIRKKDQEETVKIVSEKNALLENLKAQIIKLEQQQMATFGYVLQTEDEEQIENFQKLFIKRQEHDVKVKKLERNLSELLAKNLSLQDIEKQYTDDVNDLKVSLKAAEEIILESKIETSRLKECDKENQKRIDMLENLTAELRTTNEVQIERITLLQHQADSHRADFEMEQQMRQTALQEKQQILQDLRNLQRYNQQLMEKQQTLTENYERRLASSAGTNQMLSTASEAAATYFNSPQRPLRLPESPSAATGTTPPAAVHCCPVCNKAFKCLNILQSHVYDCLDKN